MAENETDDVLEEASDEDVLEEASPEETSEKKGLSKLLSFFTRAKKTSKEDEDSKESSSEESDEKKGLSKSTIIKIAIGVIVVLILAAGGYFFFLSNEELPEEKGAGISESDVASEAKKSDISTDKEKSQVSETSKDEKSTIELPQIPEDNPEKDVDPNNINSTEKGERVSESGVASEAKKSDISTDNEKVVDHAKKTAIQQKELKQETEAATVTNEDVAVSKSNKEKADIASDKLSESTIIKQQTQLKSKHYQTIYGEDTRGYPWTRPAKTEPAPKPKWGKFDRLSDKK